MTSSEDASSLSKQCRICHEGPIHAADDQLEELIEPCECSGTVALIHASCLEKWLAASNTDRCEICKYKFTINRKKKPISQWWRTKGAYGPRGMAGDVVCLVVLTPLCFVATYLCALGASSYRRHGHWEGTGLAVLCSLLVASYSIWLFVTIRFHLKVWRRWRRTHQNVTLLVKAKGDRPTTSQAQNFQAVRKFPRNISIPLCYKYEITDPETRLFYEGLSRQIEPNTFV